MNHVVCTSLLLLVLTLPLAPGVLAGEAPPPGVDAQIWREIEATIAAQVDAELASGTKHGLRGSLGAAHGLMRRQVLTGHYADLPPQDAPAGPEFGYSVAISGDWLAVGAPGTIQSRSGLVGEWGATFLFQREGSTWVQRHRILGAGGTEPARCGHAVALRMPYLVVGCPRSSVEGFSQTGRWNAYHVTADVLSSAGNNQFAANVAVGSQCGSAVAISSNYMAYGCPYWGPAGSSNRGRVFVYRRASNETMFVYEAAITVPTGADNFGRALAIRQGPILPTNEPPTVRLAIGAPTSVFPGSSAWRGSVFVYQRPHAIASWTLDSTLRPAPAGTNSAPYASFGAALAMNRDQLLVGAPTNQWAGIGGQQPDGPGTVHRYALINSADSWQWQARQVTGPVNSPDGPRRYQKFGAAVSLGFDNLIAVGAPGVSSVGSEVSDVGLVEIRRAPTGEWGLDGDRGELRPAGDASLHVFGYFGTSLGFDASGRTLAVGMPRHGLYAQPPVLGGQVWLYDEGDAIFDNGFQCRSGWPGC